MTIEFDLSDAESYKLYWETIATKNKLLGADKYLYGDMEIGQHEAARWKGRKLWAWPATRLRGSLPPDNYFFNREGTVWIGGPSPAKFEEQDTYYFECEKLAKQVLSKVLADYTDAKLAINFITVVLDRSDMIIGATKFIGCEIMFTFSDPNDLEYDENDWNL